MPVFQVAVLIPFVAVRDLHEADALFAEAPRQQALPPEVVGRLLIDAVQVERRLALVGDIHQVRRFGLHPEGQFKRLDAAFQLRIAAKVPQLLLVHALQHVQLHPLQIGWDVVVADVVDGGGFGGNAGVADGRALIRGGQKRARPVLYAAMSERGADGDETGQVLVFGAQTIGDPRSHAGANKRVGTRVHGKQRAAMRRVAAVNRANDAQIIDMLRHIAGTGRTLRCRTARTS